MIQKVNGHLVLVDAVYRVGKKLVQVYIPALSAMYFSLGQIWGFPEIEKVCGSCAIVSIFIGACLGISSKSYEASNAAYDGEILIHETKTGKKTYSLELYGDPEDIDMKNTVLFRVPKE